jgi:AcrR family transcriptional regulator
MTPSAKPYHHGRLREAVLEAAVAEIDAVGPARLSMREIARRAGVSHAAPAHHFGDKAGIFTAIATEGYRLLRETTSRAATGDDGLLQGGLAYVGFALTHRAYFDVMFRPELYRADDPDLIAARDAALDVMYQAVERGLAAGEPGDVRGTTMAAWSVAHGFAVLWLNGNLPPELVEDPDAVPALVAGGIVALGDITRRQATSLQATLGTDPATGTRQDLPKPVA